MSVAGILKYIPKAKDLSHPANQLHILTLLQTDSDLCFLWDAFASHPLVNEILFSEFITMLFTFSGSQQEALLFLFLRKGIRVNT